MGCNCGKNSTPPAGAQGKNAASGDSGARITPASAAPPGVAVPATRPTQQSFSAQLASDAERVRRAAARRPVR